MLGRDDADLGFLDGAIRWQRLPLGHTERALRDDRGSLPRALQLWGAERGRW